MTFTELLNQIDSERSQAFRVLKARYLLGVETEESIRLQSVCRRCHMYAFVEPSISPEEAEEIISENHT